MSISKAERDRALGVLNRWISLYEMPENDVSEDKMRFWKILQACDEIEVSDSINFVSKMMIEFEETRKEWKDEGEDGNMRKHYVFINQMFSGESLVHIVNYCKNEVVSLSRFIGAVETFTNEGMTKYMLWEDIMAIFL